MDCGIAKKLIPALLDGELTPDKSEQLCAHLASCQECREDKAVLARTIEALGVCQEIEPSFTLADVRERAARRSGGLVFGWLLQGPRLVTAAMVIAAITVGGISGAYYGSHSGGRDVTSVAVTHQQVSETFTLEAFDDGLAGAVYMAGADGAVGGEVTQ